MKPLIGITCDYDWAIEKVQINREYYEGIRLAGGLPFLIPCMGVEDIPLILDRLDGLMLTGGADVDPALFGESQHPKLGKLNPERDKLEIALCRQAMERGIPILGICRGHQVMNVAMGGTLYQDLESQWNLGQITKHFQSAPGWHETHKVKINEGCRLRDILGSDLLGTNSYHHQAVKDPAPCFDITAFCVDGVAEAIESRDHDFAVGIQWHPERMYQSSEAIMNLFKAFISAAKTLQLSR
jgi:putative glutamine amidotransferase